MSDQQETQETNASLTASDLLMEGFVYVPDLSPNRDIGGAEAMLVAAYATIAKLDAMEAAHLEAMRGLQKSIDTVGAALSAILDELKRTARG